MKKLLQLSLIWLAVCKTFLPPLLVGWFLQGLSPSSSSNGFIPGIALLSKRMLM
jgi:hypothetical protein